MSFPIDLELPAGADSLLRESLIEEGIELHRISFRHASDRQEMQGLMSRLLGGHGYTEADCRSLLEDEIEDWTVFEHPSSDVLVIFSEDPLREGAFLLLSCPHPQRQG
ncbi:hypothetical protein KDL44_00385 [bacterium]|nr:hypothetical protein [bacterium]